MKKLLMQYLIVLMIVTIIVFVALLAINNPLSVIAGRLAVVEVAVAVGILISM